MRKFLYSILIAALALGAQAANSTNWYLYWCADFTDNNPLKTGEELTLWLDINGVQSTESISSITPETTRVESSDVPGLLVRKTTLIGAYETKPTQSIRVMLGDYATGTASYMTTLTSAMYDSYIGTGTSPTSSTLNVAQGTWSVVPEPTSALLVLLGLAGLALRRRSADGV